MDKEELLKMAREAGCPTWFGVAPMEFVENFANAILERAATVAESEPKVWDFDAPSPQQRIATKIRAMKNSK